MAFTIAKGTRKRPSLRNTVELELFYTVIFRTVILTSLLGTVTGVPSFTTPASTTTPTTIGPRELKMCWGRIRSLHGKTAMCLNSSRFFCLSSWWNELNTIQNCWKGSSTALCLMHLFTTKGTTFELLNVKGHGIPCVTFPVFALANRMIAWHILRNSFYMESGHFLIC